MNLETKNRFLTDENRAALRALTEKEFFLRALEVSLLEAQGKFLANGGATEAMALRLDGAAQFAQILINLAEPVPRPKPLPTRGNLDHNH